MKIQELTWHKELVSKLEDVLEYPIINVEQLSSGQWSSKSKISTYKASYFIKYAVNDSLSPSSNSNLKAEYANLKFLEKHTDLTIPTSVKYISSKSEELLIMEFVPQDNNSSDNYWINAGIQLAQLHKHELNEFGFEYNNFIGPIHQNNQFHKTSFTFYINNRINPMVKIAFDNKLLSNDDLLHFDLFYKELEQLKREERAQLIHGDLWNGNIMMNEDGNPLFIDPSISYSFREMDLAMTSLFGGFPQEFYAAYNNIYPISDHYLKHKEIYSLYYLLVHLIIFGHSYYSDTMNCVFKYT